MENLRGATVVITGASSGIGLATARAFAHRDANVVLAARRRELLERAARGCEAPGGRALAVPTEVTDPAQVRRLAEAAASAFGGIDVWVNNAGTSMWGALRGDPARIPGAPDRAEPARRDPRLPRGAAPLLRPGRPRRDHQRLLDRWPLPMPFAANYSASKFGLTGFTETLRAELAARSGIRVCGVYPAYVDTPTYLESANYTGRALRPVPPVVPPERVAERIVRLALRPHRSARAGASNDVTVPFALAPDATGRLMGRLAKRFLLHSGLPADATDGGLWEPVPTAEAAVRGGWGMPERRWARRAAAVATFAGLAGASAFLSRRVRGA